MVSVTKPHGQELKQVHPSLTLWEDGGLPHQPGDTGQGLPKDSAVQWAAPAKPLSTPHPAPGPQTCLAKSFRSSICLRLIAHLDLLFVY